ncbi:hypothetical protein ACFLU5_09480 [Bacteroidota bacterium]
MMSARPYIWIVLVSILITSCFHKSTCPAYYSKYILDQQEIQKRFSLFAVDSLPKDGIGYVKKSKFGIIEEKPYRQKYNEIKDIPMVTVYPEIVDSILMVRNITDSLGPDSLGVSTGEPFLRNVNYDQIIYNSLYYDLLVPPEEEDITEELLDKAVEEEETGEGEKQKKGIKDLFRRKKKKSEPEEDIFDNIPERTPTDEPAEEEDDGF